jgi:hypothetical protein
MPPPKAPAIIIEWGAIPRASFERLRAAMKQPVFGDLRNVYRPEDSRASPSAAGDRYHRCWYGALREAHRARSQRSGT